MIKSAKPIFYLIYSRWKNHVLVQRLILYIPLSYAHCQMLTFSFQELHAHFKMLIFSFQELHALSNAHVFFPVKRSWPSCWPADGICSPAIKSRQVTRHPAPASEKGAAPASEKGGSARVRKGGSANVRKVGAAGVIKGGSCWFRNTVPGSRRPSDTRFFPNLS